MGAAGVCHTTINYYFQNWITIILLMPQSAEKLDQKNSSEPVGVAEHPADRSSKKLLFAATELCLLYLQCEKLLKKQEIVLGGSSEDVR